MLYSMPLVTFLVLRALYALGDAIRYHFAKLDGHIDVYEEAFDRFSDETENVARSHWRQPFWMKNMLFRPKSRLILDDLDGICL